MKRGLNFSAPYCKRKPKYDRTYLLFLLESFVVRFSLLMTSFQSFFWNCLYFLSRCSSLNIRLFSYAFSCSLSRSSRRILLILASFLTFLRVFFDSLYGFYFLLSLVSPSLSLQIIFTQKSFYTNLDYNNLLRLTEL